MQHYLDNQRSIKNRILKSVFFVAILFSAWGTPSAGFAEKGIVVESSKLKVALLWKLINFTHWEDREEENESWKLCLTKKNTLNEYTDLLQGKLVRGKPIDIAHVTPSDAIHHCHVLLVASEESEQFQLEKIPRHILSIGEDNEFLDNGGIVQIFIHKQKLKFNINRQALKSSKVRLDARVLRLAVNRSAEP